MIGDIKYFSPQSAGWLETKLSEEAMNKLWFYINKYKTFHNHNSQLVGNISSSWLLSDDDNWFYQNVLLPLMETYKHTFNNRGNFSATTKFHKYILNSLWVNFQKQHEFNPIHGHGGVYSFVVWMKIPYDYREQHQLSISANSQSPSASNFEFTYLNLLGEHQVHKYYLDKNSEGTILFFPSQLYHQVYPFFNCNEERISISGNISLDTSYYLGES